MKFISKYVHSQTNAKHNNFAFKKYTTKYLYMYFLALSKSMRKYPPEDSVEF